MFVTIYIVMNIKILATNKNILCPKHSVTINIERHISLTFHTATAENQWEISPCLVSQNMVSFSEPSESNTKLEIYKAFQDRLTFLNRHMIVWLGWDPWISQIYWKCQTASYFVFWKPWPAVDLKKYQRKNSKGVTGRTSSPVWVLW